VAQLLGVVEVDLVDLRHGEVALAVLGCADLAFHGVAGAQAEAADLLGADLDVVGAGHALKALNNLLSATTFLASCEAVEIGRRFGLDPETMLDAINASTGRSLATERKLPDQVLTGRYASGFALALMAKDMRIAVGLADALGAERARGERARELWEQAREALPVGADQTEVARWVHDQGG
jgi:3-hydroxyisobutyrate dehydrogenase